MYNTKYFWRNISCFYICQYGGGGGTVPPNSDTPVSVPTVLNDPAKVEGVQSFPHLEAQHGAAKTWPPISTCLDIIFQRRSVGLGSLCVSR